MLHKTGLVNQVKQLSVKTEGESSALHNIEAVRSGLVIRHYQVGPINPMHRMQPACQINVLP